MAYTYKQLSMAYAAVHGGIEPTGDAAAQLQLLTNPSFTDTDRLNYILNSADDSTAVAVMTYQFFTGKSPKADGIAWLLNSADNATDLNDPVFAKFNLEHRFMNFAASLGMSGEGRASFEASYGALTYAGYVASIYDSIIGVNQARAAGLDPDKIIQDVVARQDLILASARAAGMIGPNATAADIDLALKVATAAYLLAEGIKADVGVYAAATNNFMLDVAKGTAVYNTDITQTYAPNANSGSSGTGQAVDTPPPTTALPGGPPPPVQEPEPEPQPQGQHFTLGAGADTLTGGGGGDTFTATHLTFGSGDVLDGGAGDDTLTITVSVTPGDAYTPPNDGVKNIETVTIDSDGAINADTQRWTGLTQLNTTAVGATILTVHEDTSVTANVTQQGNGAIDINRGHDVTVTATGAASGSVRVGHEDAVTGDVVVSRQLVGNNAAGSITVNGGTTVSITQTTVADTGVKQKNGGVVVNGSEATTTVTVKAAQATADIDANAVTIRDVNAGSSSTLAGTITTVSIDGYSATGFSGTALTDLSLAHGRSNIVINNGSGGAPSATTLNLKANGLASGSWLYDQGVYQTLNITTGAEASTLANISMSSVKALTVAGDSRLTLNSTTGLSMLETVAISGAGGLTANLSGATVTSVDASAASGANTLTIDASKASFTGGAGVDTITVTAAAVSKAIALGGGGDVLDLTSATSLSAAIDGGAGADTLKIGVAAAGSLKGQSLITNVETLVLSGTGVADVGSSLASATGLTTLTLTGAAGLTADLSGASAISVDASGTTGANTVTIDGSKTAFTGGSGVDVITVTSATVSKAIALGGGDDILDLTNAASLTAALDGGTGDDTLKISTALATTLAGQTPSISGFETLELNAATSTNLGSTLNAFGWATTLAISGAGSVTADLSGAAATAVKTSGATGVSSLTIDGSKTSFTGGAGVDQITVKAGAVSKAIALGGGDDSLDLTSATSLSAAIDGGTGADTLKMTTAFLETLLTQTPSIANFETLQLTGASSGTLNLANIVSKVGSLTRLVLGDSDDTLDLGGVGSLTTALDGGGGEDTLQMTAALAATVSGPSISGFEILKLTASGAHTIDLDNFGDVSSVLVDGGGIGTSVTLNSTSAALTYVGTDASDHLTLAGGSHTLDLGLGLIGNNTVTITSAAASGAAPLYATITNFGTGDTLTLRPASGVGAANNALGGQTGGGAGSLEANLDLATAGNGGTTSQMTWFQFGGDTYVVLDNSAQATFQAGVDNVVKLVGNIDLTGLSASAGSLTFGPTS